MEQTFIAKYYKDGKMIDFDRYNKKRLSTIIRDCKKWKEYCKTRKITFVRQFFQDNVILKIYSTDPDGTNEKLQYEINVSEL